MGSYEYGALHGGPSAAFGRLELRNYGNVLIESESVQKNKCTMKHLFGGN